MNKAEHGECKIEVGNGVSVDVRVQQPPAGDDDRAGYYEHISGSVKAGIRIQHERLQRQQWLDAEAAYVISVQSKRYRFAPKLVQVFESVGNVEFGGIQ